MLASNVRVKNRTFPAYRYLDFFDGRLRVAKTPIFSPTTIEKRNSTQTISSASASRERFSDDLYKVLFIKLHTAGGTA